MNYPAVYLSVVMVAVLLAPNEIVAGTTDATSGLSWADKDGLFEISAHNPSPDTLPSLIAQQKLNLNGGKTFYAVMTFPGIPGLILDAWCFESQLVTFESAHELDGGALELRHQMTDYENLVHVTRLTPEPGAVDIVARLERKPNGDSEVSDATPEVIPENLVPNICFQLMGSPAFQSAPEEERRCTPEAAKNYWDSYISRSFVFTEEGMTFLNNTQRTDTAKDHGFEPDDPRNNPPGVQRYYGVWQSVPEGQGTSSLTRTTLPLIGAVSLDKKHLIAGVSNPNQIVTQAWLDCFHFHPTWTPANSPATERTWRIKIYGMENDAEALRRRVFSDFPGIDQLKENRAPLH